MCSVGNTLLPPSLSILEPAGAVPINFESLEEVGDNLGGDFYSFVGECFFSSTCPPPRKFSEGTSTLWLLQSSL